MTNQLENIFLTALEKNEQKLLRICSIYSKSVDESKDLFQEVLVHIWQAMPSFKGSSTIDTWMFRITLNVCMRFRSKHNKKLDRFLRMDSLTIANIKVEEHGIEPIEPLIILRNCIRELNEADRAVVALYLEELPYKEISSITGLTENTVAVKIKRIKKKLLNCINEKS